MFLCVTMTPFGLPVEPEVYWRNASEVDSTGVGCQVSDEISRSRSVDNHFREQASSLACQS